MKKPRARKPRKPARSGYGASELEYLEARLDEIKIEVERLAHMMRAAAEWRERLRGVMSPSKLEEFDAVSQEIRDAITELRNCI